MSALTLRKFIPICLVLKMDDLLIDGKIYDRDSLEEKTSSSGSDHFHDVSISSDESGYTVEVVRDDGKTWTWSLQSDRVDDLIDNLNKMGDVADGVDGLRTDLSVLSATTQETLQELQEVVDAPSDFYDFTSDVATQLVFFVSLIFGLLVFIVFSIPFRK